jgi:hypothetical protein
MPRPRAAAAREFNRRAAHIAERFVISTLNARATEALVSEAARTLDAPKIDRTGFSALVREGFFDS